MRYFIDTEFDGHNGPLLSLGMVRDDGASIHIRTTSRATDPWVVENVEPIMDRHGAHIGLEVAQGGVGDQIRKLIGDDTEVTVIADSIVDIGRFCRALSTGSDGEWVSFDGDIKFEVYDVAAYPTKLPGAVQHNAWWDAWALKYKLDRALP